MRKALCVLMVLFVVLLCATAMADENTITMDAYRDKTTAGVIGHVAGVLTGFEFIWNEDGTPMVPLPKSWFQLLGGPYGGGSAHGGAGVSRMLSNGIGSDDDYHIDFFNQHILKEEGILPSQAKIMNQWREHAVSDWGGGDKAGLIMKKQRLCPPFTGLYEYGNVFHWCTEAYIENETLGLVCPGMPVTAYRLAERFASVTGDFESLDWGLFWACAYAKAYVEIDGVSAIKAAKGALLPNSYPMAVFHKCFEMFEKGYPWEKAVVEMEAMRRQIDTCNNIQCSPDVNNGFAILAILYGENDWLKSTKYASLCGYDADCTAATVGGLMGVIKGMEGLPQEVLDILWADGAAVYVNDLGFPPHIAKDYPLEQPFSQIVDDYIVNGLKQINAYGSVIGQQLYLPEQRVCRQGWQVDDFETGLGLWEVKGDVEIAMADKAHSGNGCIEIKIKNAAESAGASTIVSGLVPFATYRLSAYVKTSFDGQAILSVDGQAAVTAYNANKGWILRECYFVAQSEAATLSLLAAQLSGDSGCVAFFDDVRLEKIEDIQAQWLSEEIIQLEKRDETVFNISIDNQGDYALIVTCLATHRTGFITGKLVVDDELQYEVAFPGTAQKGQNGTNTQYFPLALSKGEHEIQLILEQGSLTISQLGLGIWPVACMLAEF